MKTIKFIVLISSMLLVMSINTRDIYFSYILAAYASEKTIKKISDIKSVTLIVWWVGLYEDRHGVLRGFNDPTIMGIVIFKDKGGEECAIDYDGVAELSCGFFNKQFRIRPNDFKIKECDGYPHRLWCNPILNEHYGYRIEFKLKDALLLGKFPPYPNPSIRPQTVKFKLGNLEAKCILDENHERSSSEQSPWKLYKGKE